MGHVGATMTPPDTADAVIGGGGMVGLTLALAFARGGLKVVVADPIRLHEEPRHRVRRAGERGFLFFGAHAERSACGRRYSTARNRSTNLVTDAKLGQAPSPFSLHFDHREIGVPMASSRKIATSEKRCSPASRAQIRFRSNVPRLSPRASRKPSDRNYARQRARHFTHLCSSAPRDANPRRASAWASA